MPSLARRFPDQTIVCVASGPSLTAEQLALVRDLPMVAVNDAVRLAPWADVLYSSDRGWWRYYQGVEAFKGLRVSIGRKKGDASSITAPGCLGVTVLEHTGDEGLEWAPTGLRSGKHSGYAAINLAVHLGARRVLLLGYQGGPVAGRSHFFGRHPSGLNESTETHYAHFRRMYETLVAPLALAKIEVVNCTPGSAITVFPAVSLEFALAAAEVVS